MGRHKTVTDPVIRGFAEQVNGFFPFEEQPEYGATHDNSYQDSLVMKPKLVTTWPNGVHAVRVNIQRKDIIFGYFKPTDLFSAARYADMVAVRVWQFKRRAAVPPPDGSLNFKSNMLAEDDWENYADTYGHVIVGILERMKALGIGPREDDTESWVSPKRASEIALEQTLDALNLTNTKLGEMANQLIDAEKQRRDLRAQLTRMELRFEDLKKSQDVMSDRLLAKENKVPGQVFLAHHKDSFTEIQKTESRGDVTLYPVEEAKTGLVADEEGSPWS